MKKVKTNIKLLRVRGEVLSFVFLLIILVAIIIFFLQTNLYLILAAIVLGLLYIRLLQAQQLGNSIRVTEHQLPEIYNIAKRCAKNLGLKKTPYIFITQNPVMNAFTMGFKNPYIIVLNSGLVENLSLKELSFVIGHEMGHIKFWHVFLLSILYPIGKNLVFLDFLIGFWGRKTEYTSDRCGLICSENKENALLAILKVATGATVASKINLDYLSTQLQDVKSHSLNWTGELLVSHPYILKRIHEINKFSAKYRIKPCENCGNICDSGANFCWVCKEELNK